MIAMERGRFTPKTLTALVVLGFVGASPALAQSAPKGRAAAGANATPPAATDASKAAQNTGESPRFKMTAVPVNPTDPIAIINEQVITRQMLADEAVARKGEEILETLIARTLIEQALRNAKLEVTAAEVDQEIENVARRVGGIGREAWLRTLDKERGISPIQYARDIIYPSIALRKLASPKVQVTPDDLKNAFEAQYGEKLRCRMIMVDKLQVAKEIWEKLRNNPGAFEKIAREQSMDSGSASLGGLLAEPISRHAYPQTVSNAAFYQLVDGDPKDTDPSHKPKDGDFTGPIQVAEATWVILRREGIEAARPVNRNDENIKKITHEMIYEVKLKEAMADHMVELMNAAKIDNKLTGRIKLADEPVPFDKDVKLMGHKAPAPTPAAANGGKPGAAAPSIKTPPPAALAPEVVKETEALTRPPAAKK